jgi:two-component system, NtrC family, nitrogen regulation sensor histidine kinase NtrY
MDLLNRLDKALASGVDPAALRAEISRIRARVSPGELALAARQEILETLVDTTPAAIVLLDEVGTIVFTNSEARELFFESKDPQGANFLHLLMEVPETLRRALLSDSDHIFSVDSNGATETFHLSRRNVSITFEPHVVLIVRNMTLEVSRQENAVLRKAIRVIHHEFANSITPVRSLLQSVRAKIGNPEFAAKLTQTLTVIEERVLHLSAFLTGFAALGRLPLPRPEELSWETFIERLAPLLTDIVIAPAPAGKAWLDPTQMEQVIINLVKNAREAGSDPRDIRFEVAAAPEGGYRATVFDRGRGMTDEVLDHALVPSFTTKPNGSGMGLTLCREIVDAHRGRLRLARREGGGMAISFWLPPRDAASGTTHPSRARISLTRS